MQAAFEQAYSFYRAQEQSTSYGESNIAAAVTQEQSSKLDESPTNVLAKVRQKLSATESKCCYCGGYYHNRSRCPARNVDCHSCGKRGHFAKVCMSKSGQSGNRQNSVASISSGYIASAVGAPSCVNAAVVDVKIKGASVRALVDTGATENYLN